MAKKFDYQPFDRVTVDFLNHSARGVFYEALESSNTCVGMVEYGDRLSKMLSVFSVDASLLRPGHYDAAGNWLPHPGEPCYRKFFDGGEAELLPCTVIRVLSDSFEVFDFETGDTYSYAVKQQCGLLYTYRNSLLDPEKSAYIYPGRINPAEQ